MHWKCGLFTKADKQRAGHKPCQAACLDFLEALQCPCIWDQETKLAGRGGCLIQLPFD